MAGKCLKKKSNTKRVQKKTTQYYGMNKMKMRK